MSYADGPPWTRGQNCNARFRHPMVSANTWTGVFVKPDTYRFLYPRTWYRGTYGALSYPTATVLPAGKAVLEMTITCRDALLMADGSPSSKTGLQRFNTAWQYFYQSWGSPTDFEDPFGTTWSVVGEEAEHRAVDGGRYFGAGSELRLVFLQAP